MSRPERVVVGGEESKQRDAPVRPGVMGGYLGGEPRPPGPVADRPRRWDTEPGRPARYWRSGALGDWGAGGKSLLPPSTARSWRQRASLSWRVRVATRPKWRMRTKPGGTTWRRKRRRNSSARSSLSLVAPPAL